jgi:hypothetical protein
MNDTSYRSEQRLEQSHWEHPEQDELTPIQRSHNIFDIADITSQHRATELTSIRHLENRAADVTIKIEQPEGRTADQFEFRWLETGRSAGLVLP